MVQSNLINKSLKDFSEIKSTLTSCAITSKIINRLLKENDLTSIKVLINLNDDYLKSVKFNESTSYLTLLRYTNMFGYIHFNKFKYNINVDKYNKNSFILDINDLSDHYKETIKLIIN